MIGKSDKPLFLGQDMRRWLSAKSKEEHRYYLLPGMGRSNRHHRKLVFRWSLAIGLLFSLLFGFLLYFTNRR